MQSVLHQGYLALCLMILLGVLLGRIRLRGVSLDNSAVIFVALVFGHYGIMVPEDFQHIGLVLFIFTIGIQAGPGFFGAFRTYGRQLILVALITVGAGGILAVLCAKLLHLDASICIGLLTGALTSTPGLAAAIELTQSPLASIGYGLAYPFGVIGVILFVRLFPKMLRVDLPQAESAYNAEIHKRFPAISDRNFIIENEKLAGKTFQDVEFFQMTEAKISRIMHEDTAITPTKETVLHCGDLIKAVGPPEALERLEIFVGRPTQQDIPLHPQYDVQFVLVSNKTVVNKSLEELRLLPFYDITVTRIRRSGIDISPTPQSRLRLGDRLMIAGEKTSMQEIARRLGNEDKRLSETDILPIFLGILLGIVIGRLQIDLSNVTSFKLGNTGGILVVAILLSHLGKTGPILWSLSPAANQLLRQLGLLFFLSAVGTKAGANLVHTVTEYGLNLFLVGMVLTLVPMIVGGVFGHYVLRLNMLTLLGVLAGAMTSTPGLGAVDAMTDSNAPSVGYATVYPMALVLVILSVQVLTHLL